MKISFVATFVLFSVTQVSGRLRDEDSTVKKTHDSLRTGKFQTSDAETPAEESVCAGLAGNTQLYRLCFSYCETKDCDYAEGHPYCDRIVELFRDKSGGDNLPCLDTNRDVGGCPEDPNGTPDTDTDLDGTVDCQDNCPFDPHKIEPGVCDCGVVDVDADEDGVVDRCLSCDGVRTCDDVAPVDPSYAFDSCPEDPLKSEPGICGCGVSEDACEPTTCGEVNCEESQLCVANVCINTGDLTFTLTWEGDDDLDIHVVPPIGNEIWFGNPVDGASGGVLDVDQIPPSGSTDEWVENINFTTPPAGTYAIYIDNYNQYGSVDEYTLTIRVNNVVVASYTGSTTYSGQNDVYSFDYNGI